jgi:hypothetical protein
LSYKQNDPDRPNGAPDLEGTPATRHAVELLVRVLEDPAARDAALEEFQESVWLDPDQFGSETVQAIFGDLAYDLASGDANEERARKMILDALHTLGRIGVAVPQQDQ